jgi:TRAP-type mannitol/chloroaromatic compound transport system permease small subunit
LSSGVPSARAPAPPSGPAGVRAIDRLVEGVGNATSWIALAIVVLMATNVVLRYLFSIGSVWSQELEWHLLTPLIMFGISYALLHGEHVRVDVLYAGFSERSKARVDFVSALLSITICVIFIWLSFKYVQQSYVIDERSSDPGGLTHRWLLKALIPAGFALLLVQSAAVAARTFLRLRTLRP